MGDKDISAQKLDTGKLPVYQGFLRYFPRAIEAVTQVSVAGAKKYNRDIFPTKWRDVPNGELRYADAQQRHELAIIKGEDIDPETGCLHMAHEAWNLLARLELTLSGGNNGSGS